MQACERARSPASSDLAIRICNCLKFGSLDLGFRLHPGSCMCDMSTKEKTISKIGKILNDYFQKHPEIEVAYIFGSVAQGRNNMLSDIDIAIITDDQQINGKTYRYGYKAEILTDLSKLLKTNNIDLVTLTEATTLLKHRVLYYGKLIYSKNERKRIDFQIDTINRYNDFKHLMKTHVTKVADVDRQRVD